MSDNDTGLFHRHNAALYGVAIGLIIVLTVIALVSYRGAKADQAAKDKADQLISKLKNAGVERVPSQDQVARVLGDDGGAVCEDPGSALRKATLYSMMVNGAGGPGIRPVITDSVAVKGQLAIMSVYCPDKLESFRKYVDNLTYGDVVKG